eukprot:g7232.t1
MLDDMEFHSCDDLSPELEFENEDRETLDEQNGDSCFVSDDEIGEQSSMSWSEQEYDNFATGIINKSNTETEHEYDSSSSHSSFSSTGIASGHFEEHFSDDDDNSIDDSLDQIITQETEAFLQRQQERHETLCALHNRSQSAPTRSMNLASPNTSAQRKRSAEGRMTIESAEHFDTDQRIEYKPRESNQCLIPYQKGEQDSSRIDLGRLEEAKLDPEWGPWSDLTVEAELPKLMKPVKKTTIKKHQRQQSRTEFMRQKASQRNHPNSASKWRQSETSRPDWNFDTNLSKSILTVQKRPLSAAEITQKVQTLIIRASSNSTGHEKARCYGVSSRCRNKGTRHPYLQTRKHSNPQYLTPLLSKEKNAVIKLGNLEGAISEANEMAEELGGRYRYRRLESSSLVTHSSIKVFDCDNRVWLKTPFTIERFRKRFELLKDKIRIRKLRQNCMEASRIASLHHPSNCII